MSLAEMLPDLARLDPERFGVPFGRFVVIHGGSEAHVLMCHAPDFADLAILSAVVIEGCAARGWDLGTFTASASTSGRDHGRTSVTLYHGPNESVIGRTRQIATAPTFAEAVAQAYLAALRHEAGS